MGNTGSQPRVSARDRAILDLKLQRDKIQKYLVTVRAAAGREEDLARACLREGDRARALLALRRKKYQTARLAEADEQLATLEKLVDDVEFALIRKDVLFGIEQGTAALRDVQAQMGGVEGVERVMRDNEEAAAYQQELDDIVSSRLAVSDIAAVDAELDAMEAELVADKFAKVPATVPKIVEPDQNTSPAHGVRQEPEPELNPEAEERQLVPA